MGNSALLGWWTYWAKAIKWTVKIYELRVYWVFTKQAGPGIFILANLIWMGLLPRLALLADRPIIIKMYFSSWLIEIIRTGDEEVMTGRVVTP